MELRLTVQPPVGRSRDLLVELEPFAPVRALLDALAQDVGLPAHEIAAATLGRDGRRLQPDEPVAAAGLRDGDVLALELADPDTPTHRPPAPRDGAALADLVVVGGPLMGTRVGLVEGAHVIGRGPGADIVLADGSLSRRHLELSVAGGDVAVRDLGSSNGTFIEGVAVDGRRALAAGEAVEAGRSLLAVEPRSGAADEREGDGRGGVPFNRPPRVARPWRAHELSVPAPPRRPDSAPIPLVPALVPLVLAGVMWAVTSSPVMLMVGVLTPTMALYNWYEGRRRGRSSHGSELAAFRERLDEAAAELGAAREEEAHERRRAAPDAAELRARVERLAPELWERRPGDADFLEVRLGVADQPSRSTATVDRGGDAELRRRAQERLGGGAAMPGLPVTAPAGGLALAGPAARVDALARWVVAQAALLHSPTDVAVAAALSRERAREWDWLKWLPHTRDPSRLAVGEDAARELLEALPRAPQTLLVLDGELTLDRARLAEVHRDGVSVLWLGAEARDAPGQARSVAELDRDLAKLRLTRVETGETIEDVAADGVTREWAEGTARLLAPVRDTGAPGAAGQVPARVSLLDLLELPDPTPTSIARCWQARDGSLAAPLGLGADGPFTIDAGRTEGLRALIGGMPGAGKSELLQSLVAALAVRHPPDRLAFLLVDYKGGAAFKDCVDLPHTVGLVTDLDAHLAERARVSLLAELRRREAILARAGARNLAELTRRDPAGAPPALLIVVDEFAALVREVPAFVDTLVDVAQRGRSLGLHLVLATQRPRGVVSDTIRANTNLRIAMRMADGAESSDVIEAPDAAEIPAGLAGRALALTGRAPGGAPELTAFQVAYAGGRSAGVGETVVRVSDFAAGVVRTRAERVLSIAGVDAPTDLQAIVLAARAAAEDLGLERPASPWLPPLPERLTLAEVGAHGTPDVAVVGLVDEPERQSRGACAFDLERDGSLLVYGASGAGKTTLLRTLAASLALAATPRELHLYGLDFASRGLPGLEALPHCGAVVTADDEERTMRLLGHVQRVMAQRRAAFAAAGASGLADYRRGHPGEPVARIVLLLDGYPAFASAYERVSFGDALGTLHRIAADGRPLGVHLVATADRRASVPGALAGVVAGRIVLRLADEDDYASLGVPRTAAAGVLPPGRGFTRDGLELQVAAADEDPADLGRRLAEAFPHDRAPRIGRLPAHVPRDRMPAPEAPLTALVGVGGETLQPLSADVRDDHFLVAGPLRSGRTTALATLVASLRAGTPGLETHLLAPRRSALAALGGWSSAAEGAEAARAAADRLALELLERPAGAPPALVVLDDGGELAEAMALETLARRGRDAGVRLLAAVESHAAHRAFGGWLREVRNGRRGLLLAPDPETDGDLLGVRLPQRSPAPPAPGRGYLVVPGAAELVQVAAG